MNDYVKQFKAIQRASTPLVAIRTSDQPVAVQTITESYNGDVPPILEWDAVRGVQPRNALGFEVCWRLLLNKGDEPVPTTESKKQAALNELTMKTTNLIGVLQRAGTFPGINQETGMKGTLLFVHNAQLFLRNEALIQAICNCRDVLKEGQRMLVLLGTLGMSLPIEFADDTTMLEVPMPSTEQLVKIVKLGYRAAGLEPPEDVTPAVSAIEGLPAFPSEQAIAQSFVKRNGNRVLDIDSVMERKKKKISEIKGFTVYRGKERFSDIGGLDNGKNVLTRFMRGRRPANLIVINDEIEKQIGGQNGDSSGSTQMQIGKLLTWSADKAPDGFLKVAGVLLVGPPGSGKSLLGKALGNEFDKPTIVWDLGDNKSKYIGESEAYMSQALSTLDTLGGGSILWVVTCNNTDKLTPELLGRFSLVRMMVDLPSPEEREAIWQINFRKFNLDPNQARPDDTGWVGREIESCAYKAYLFNSSLVEAAEYIIPNSVTKREELQALREQVEGRYISASYNGPYQIRKEPRRTAVGAGRQISFED